MARQSADPDADVVTVLLEQQVAPGFEAEFQAWFAGLRAAAERSPGHLGSGLLRPAHGGDKWHVLHRFSDEEAYLAWLDSPERAHWLAAIDTDHHRLSTHRVLHGTEGWFAPAPLAPPRWKMAIGSFLAILPITLTANLLLLPHLTTIPTPVRTLVIAALFSVLMTYVAMPIVSKALRGWLYPKPPAPPIGR